MVRKPHQRLSAQERALVLETVRLNGTLKSAEVLPGMTEWAIRQERDVDPEFNKLILESMELGKLTLGDNALDAIRQCAAGEVQMSKSQLTANLALANAYAGGFKGVRHSESKVQPNVWVITSVPRPRYAVTTPLVIDVEAREIVDAKTEDAKSTTPAKKATHHAG